MRRQFMRVPNHIGTIVFGTHDNYIIPRQNTSKHTPKKYLCGAEKYYIFGPLRSVNQPVFVGIDQKVNADIP